MKETAKSFVLDAEAVAVDRKTGQLKPFQELSKRKRKDVKVEDIEVWVCLFAFDLLYLNGEVRTCVISFLVLPKHAVSHYYIYPSYSAGSSFGNTFRR